MRFVKDRVIKVVAQVLGVPVETVDSDSSPDSLPAWDSLKHMNLVLTLEEEFGVQFTDIQVLEMLNVGLIVTIVTEAVAA